MDGPVSFYTPNGPYTPHNYEADYKGTMTLLNAFAEVLHPHRFLGDLHIERATLLLKFRQAAALVAKILFTSRDLALLRATSDAIVVIGE